ncbi:MAG: pyruvate formate lyase family protein [Clostridia bacterium]|jgi:pyruvate formate-lyase/glycerol dehydratase family glycyl radical enzyme
MNSINVSLKEEISGWERARDDRRILLRYRAYRKFASYPNCIRRALAFSHLLLAHSKKIYKHDLIVGSIAGLYTDMGCHKSLPLGEEVYHYLGKVGERSFLTHYDHAAPNYARLLSLGIRGLLEEVRKSAEKIHDTDEEGLDKKAFLKAVEISLKAFRKYILQYARLAGTMATKASDPAERTRLLRIQKVCTNISMEPPKGFYEALQLIWFAHTVFVLEGRYAMALGRMDQFLFPFYQEDIKNRRITDEECLSLLENTFLKIGELKAFTSNDDVVNICIGGVKADGSEGVNRLSYLILEAVKNVHIPGPNLSARIHRGTDDEFYMKCLELLKTGIGYPALFNDEVNIPALLKKGYPIELARDYCMVGCIETYLPGKQPPWSDGRFNTPKYIELALNDGICMITGKRIGVSTGNPCDFQTFEDFMEAFQKQIRFAAREYTASFNRMNRKLNPKEYTAPFLSALFDDCIKRARDINDGGTLFPTNHGVACMGIGTTADSLAAIRELVYEEKAISMAELVQALRDDFNGHDEIRYLLKNRAPKYGNDMDAVDRYAIWFVEYLSSVFNGYQTFDGGHFFILMAANVNNVSAGKETAATTDGRKAFQPLSDAASPTYGADRKGPTAVINSVTKADYTLVTGGTVLNQKFHPSCFDGKESMEKMVGLIRSYFQKGGQEIQMNVISRDTLVDAMKHPEKYEDLIVRVSGFSAHFNQLADEVKMDIIRRTEQFV